MKSVILCLSFILACAAGQRITTIQLDNVQYFVSRMNPYSPELNYFLAYQYCRSLGLQLASFETKEKVESMTQYLQNAGYSKYDFWTSGNRLGTGMFLWMSSGLPFNATFDYFEGSNDSVASELDPHDHNSNTSPQRTARDSTSGLEKGCVILKAPSLKWAPQDCSAVKDFICEQTRCYYYNYGSIPVSSAQGRPIFSSPSPSSSPTSPMMMSTTPLSITSTPLPMILSSTYSAYVNKQTSMPDTSNTHKSDESAEEQETEASEKRQFSDDVAKVVSAEAEEETEAVAEHEYDDIEHQTHEDESTSNNDVEEMMPVTQEEEHDSETEVNHENTEENVEQHYTAEEEEQETTPEHEIPVEQKIKEITEEIEKYSNPDNTETDTARQSFFSLSDLIKTLRTNENKKQLPAQIDSDYSNTMRVLGDQTSLNSGESRQFKDSEITKINNRALN